MIKLHRSLIGMGHGIAIGAILMATNMATASELSLTASDGFELKADYYAAKASSKKAVVLLHQCNMDRSMYKELGESFKRKGIHVLSLDLRGFGGSVDAQTSINFLQLLPPEEHYQAEVFGLWAGDVALAYDTLKERVGDNAKVGVLGASCGGEAGQMLAAQRSVQALSFFSSNVLNPNDSNSVKGYQDGLASVPTLFIAAENDQIYAGTKKASELNTAKNSTFFSYEGGEHGAPLLESQIKLSSKIIKWFAKNL
ncbi:MAG: dienelactone hydrolase [Flavobacteriales bacterium]|jgi:dienelactone hydrolase